MKRLMQDTLSGLTREKVVCGKSTDVLRKAPSVLKIARTLVLVAAMMLSAHMTEEAAAQVGFGSFVTSRTYRSVPTRTQTSQTNALGEVRDRLDTLEVMLLDYQRAVTEEDTGATCGEDVVYMDNQPMDGMKLRCTCECAGVYEDMEGDDISPLTDAACESLDDNETECVNRHGQKGTLDDCKRRLIPTAAFQHSITDIQENAEAKLP